MKMLTEDGIRARLKEKEKQEAETKSAIRKMNLQFEINTLKMVLEED